MRAAICTAYGGPEVVKVRDVPTPVPKDDEVAVRVRAATASSGDSRVRASNFPGGFWLPGRVMFGLTRPRQPVLGSDCAGIVEAVGSKVTRFRPGDAVLAASGMRAGCHAQFVTMREGGALVRKADKLSFEEAAALPFGGTAALHFLCGVANLQRGERVLINGASGAVGTAAVQIAKHFGAHVTGVTSAANSALVRSLGADSVIDYTTTNLTTVGERWDIIADAVGNLSLARCRDALNPKGRLLLLVGGLGDLFKSPFLSLTSGYTVASGPAPERAEDLALLQELCEAGAFKPVIDSVYPLDRIVEAHARVDSGRKTGNVVVTID